MAFLNHWSHQYELVKRDSNENIRTGALLKIEFAGIGLGYSDLHPWPEFGEPFLEAHLHSLASQTPTPLAARAIHNAMIDARARQNKNNLLHGIENITNNALILDVLAERPTNYLQKLEQECFTHLKIKVGQNPSLEIFEIKNILAASHLFLRLDANGKLTSRQAQDFVSALTPEERARIEYFEDPCPFNPIEWAGLRNLIPLALDWQAPAALALNLPAGCWDVIIVKPSRADLDFWIQQALSQGTKLTITSSMDHPLGVMMSLACALKVQTEFPSISSTAGCLTLDLYQSNSFSSQVGRVGPTLRIIEAEAEFGFGFTTLLESLPWK
jgi:O-succinylbenzoate synthase